MKILDHIPFFLNEAYLYDIVSCHYQIFKKYNLNTENIDNMNKLERNTFIGKLMRNNSNLISFLRTITNDSIDIFIEDNCIDSSDIILRQYDGIITDKYYRETEKNNEGIIPELRCTFQPLIISSDRKSYIAIDENDNITIKGISNKYDYLTKIYRKILKINYANLECIFRNLQKIKDDLYNENNLLYFCIPERDNKFSVYLKYYGITEISKSTIKMLSKNDINIDTYFDLYIKPFTEAITISFLK